MINGVGNEDALVTAVVVSQMLGGTPLGTLAVWRCNRRYNLPFVKIGKNIRYKRSDVLKFIEERTIRPEAAR